MVCSFKWRVDGRRSDGALVRFRPELAPVGVAIYLALGAGSLIAGYFGLASKIWAYWLLFGVFLVQLVEYSSDSFFFSLIGPLSLKLGWGWSSPASSFNINIIALVVCSLAYRCAIALTERFGAAPSLSAEL